MSEISAVLNSKVLIASLVLDGKARDISSRWCAEIRRQGRTVINDVTREYRMRIREVVVDTEHAVILTRVSLIGRDQVAGSVPIVRSIRSRKQFQELLYARINANGNAPVRRRRAAAPRIGWGQQASMGKCVGHSGNRGS